jgi:3-methyladenine DNA glycosylase/8-oxoguanine DNA glycosylase
MGKLITNLGPCALVPKPDETYPALLRSITYQQLNGKAAATILGRVLDLFPNRQPKPEKLLRLPEAKLRGAGLSANKLASMRDLSQKTMDQVVPTRAQAEKMSDAELVERLTEVRGIGPWTAHMFLIFYLGRPDVLPTGDFAIQSAFKKLYGRRSIEKHGEKWAPWRTVASWYLWRSLD